MLISLLVLLLIAAGGMALTYAFVEDEPFMWRLSAGCVIGSAVFGLTDFVAASVFGFSTTAIIGSLAVTMLPLLLFWKREIRSTLLHDWAKAKGKLQGGNLRKFRAFAYYAFFFLLFWFFFQQAMYETRDGIFTGGSQNLGDLPFHLGAIFGFTDGNNFPPQNPSFAGARFSYPFIADFISACLVKLGADVKSAMFVFNLAWAFSLLVILERFGAKLAGNKLAGRIVPVLLFFSGGLGFLWFFKDYWESGIGLLNFLWHLPRDYTTGDQFRWGNSMVVLFITQRSLLLGMPLTVLVLGYLWRVFGSENVKKGESEKDADATPNVFTISHFHFSTFVVGLLAGTLPLIHLHSLIVLFVVTAFLFVFRIAKWREWFVFGVGVSLIAVPELIWSMTGSASETSKFIGWHFGWDKGDTNILWFWIKNTGLVIPVIIAGIYLLLSPQRRGEAEEEVKRQKGKGKTEKASFSSLSTLHSPLLIFYLPFAFLFIISNVAKLAPWEWDNIKILIYWYLGSLPFIALAIVWAWDRNRWMKIAAAVCFAILILSGPLDVWRTASGQNKIKVFDRDGMAIAEQIKARTAPNALFLNAPTYNSAVVLSGRRSLMRYSGHLASHGIDYSQREDDVKRIYEGGGVAEILLRKYDIEYVMVSPEEKTLLPATDDPFKKYPVVAEAGKYRVYKVKN